MACSFVNKGIVWSQSERSSPRRPSFELVTYQLTDEQRADNGRAGTRASRPTAAAAALAGDGDGGGRHHFISSASLFLQAAYIIARYLLMNSDQIQISLIALHTWKGDFH